MYILEFSKDLRFLYFNGSAINIKTFNILIVFMIAIAVIFSFRRGKNLQEPLPYPKVPRYLALIALGIFIMPKRTITPNVVLSGTKVQISSSTPQEYYEVVYPSDGGVISKDGLVKVSFKDLVIDKDTPIINIEGYYFSVKNNKLGEGIVTYPTKERWVY